jgi:phage protein D
MSDKAQTSIPVVTIKINSKDLSEAETDLNEIVIDTSYNLPSMATLRFYDQYMKWIDSDLFKLGGELSITMAPPQMFELLDPAEVFLGEIVAIEPSLSASGTHTLTVRAYDRSHRLHIGTKVMTYTNMNDSRIVGNIARAAGLTRGKIDTNETHDYVIQNNLTDFEFLSMRAKRAGYHLAVVQNKIYFQKPESVSVGASVTLGEDLRAVSIRMSTARQAQTVEVRGWDFRTKKEIVASFTPKMIFVENGIGDTGGAATKTAISANGIKRLTNLAPQTADEAKAIAAAAAVDQEGHFIEIDGVALGDPSLVAGIKVELKGLGKNHSGKYFVTSATHILNASGYEVHFTCSGRYPQTFSHLLNGAGGNAPEVGTIYGVVIGVVTNVKDPDGLGRVKVKFPWMAEANAKVESNWARIAAPSAGKSRGFYFLPEVDDEVLVAFEHGNPNYPYIVGMLWNGKDAPSEKNTVAHTGEGTIHRMIVSRLGHRVVFDDSNSKKSILIEDSSKNQSIFIDTVKNAITIKAAGNMLIDVKGNIDINAGGNINIKANGAIKSDSLSLEMLAKTTIKLDAKAMIEMKAAGSLKMESMGAAQLDGSIINISSKGPLAAKGLPITLN